MADTKITALTALTGADPANDVIPIVDVSDTTMAASGTTKKISVNNILGASGTATLASATITGDLTVDTSTLKVDSGTNNVSIGGLVNKVTGVSGSGTGLTIQASAGPTLGIWDTTDPSYFTNLAQVDANCYLYNNAAGALLFGVGNVEAMRLNSTGLGVGASPGYKLHVGGYSSANIAPDAALVRSSSGTTIQSGPNLLFSDGTSVNNVVLQNTQGRFGIWNYGAGVWNERLSVDANGNCGIGVTPSGSGGCLQLKSGITFPATQVASSDANTLDDYVEGTFTPVIQGVSTAGTGVYTVQSGRYTKIGNRVFVDIFLNWTAHTGTGAMLIANLPFTIKNASNYYPSVTFGQLNNITLAANSVLTGYGTFNTKTLNLDQYPVGGGATSSVQMDPSGSIVCSVCYEV